jgi:flagellar basal body-associated protein FliL
MSRVRSMLAERSQRAEEHQKLFKEFERQHRRSRYFMLILMSINIFLMVVSLYFVWRGTATSSGETPSFKSVSVLMAVSVSLFAFMSIYLTTIRSLYQKKFRIRLGKDDLDVEVGERTKDIRRKLGEALDRGSE